jgi:hypothetical protein
VSKIYDDMEKVESALEMLENLKKRVKKLPQDKEEKLKKFKALLEQLEAKSVSLMEEREKLEEEMEHSTSGKLKVKDIIYPGVTINIRKGIMQVKSEIKYATIVYEDGYLKINPYA